MEGDRFAGLSAALAGAAGLSLVVALAFAWAPLVTTALALVGAEYAAFLALAEGGLDLAAPLLAASLLLAGELAYGAIDPRAATARLGVRLARAGWLLSLAAGAALVAAFVLVASEVEVRPGLALELLGVLAAIAALALVAVLARTAGGERS